MTTDDTGRPDKMVPYFRPALPQLADYIPYLEEIWASGMVSNFAVFCERLEKLTSSYLETEVLAVVSADIGLILTLKALGLRDGAPCFLSDFTFNSTINAAIWNRLTPILIDIDPATLNLSPASLEDALSAHPQPGVVLATHVFGNPCDTAELTRIARIHGSYLVFDAAHAYGSLREGFHVGRAGDAEVFSLSGTKLTTSAEGGLVASPHPWLRERLRYLRAYGFQFDYDSKFVGINGKISELHCSLGLLTLAAVEDAVRQRHRVKERYRMTLGDSVAWQYIRPNDRSTYKDIVIGLGENRDRVAAALASRGVQTKNYFRPLHLQEAYARYATGPISVSSHTYRTTLCVPAFNDLSDNDVDYVAGVIRAALRAVPGNEQTSPSFT